MNEFNTQQLDAMRAEEGIHLVIAGPGTGKTRTMIERIKNTISRYCTDPERILILTFSRKAAEEIRERLASASNMNPHHGFTGTFHSFCLKLLTDNARLYLQYSGMEHFPSIIDSEHESMIMKKIFMESAERFLGLPYDAAMRILNSRKPLHPKAMKRLATAGLTDELENFRQMYVAYKTEHSLIDYADMTEHVISLLRLYPELREKVQSQFDFIFVDEYQDTSDSDHELLTLISGNKTGIFMVGDDCQSIYRFRGARYEYIVNAKEYFPAAVIHKLTINYRSHSEIVDLSNRFIRNNRFRTGKKIVSATGSGGIIRYHQSCGITDESDIINVLLSGKGNDLSCALLCRNNWQLDRLQLLLKDHARKPAFLSMHSSKGLEFDMVIIAGVDDKIIPDKDSHIEDERRLFYVALTRARKELHIIYRKNSDGSLPRFISECGYRGK